MSAPAEAVEGGAEPTGWRIARVLTGVALMAAGSLHFVMPEPYVRIVPESLPAPDALVAISGAAEILGGAGLLVRRTRRAAAGGLVLLLVAVFPANVNMAVNADRFSDVAPAWALWARLPAQVLLIALVVLVARERGAPAKSGAERR